MMQMRDEIQILIWMLMMNGTFFSTTKKEVKEVFPNYCILLFTNLSLYTESHYQAE
jgi:hypothetical protein